MAVPPRRALPAIAVTCALAAPPAAAAAAATFTFEGRGFGHGVGMSQHGARGAALQGWDAERILGHYYRGASVASRPPATLRVRVVETAPAIALASPVPMTVSFGGGPPATIPAGAYVVRRAGAGVVLADGSGRVIAIGATPLGATAAGDALLRIAGSRLRGGFRAHAVPGGLDGVNVVGQEDYLRGVLPREVPASWGDRTPAALDAQAIAARSYALASRRSSGHFDLHADVRSQVYGGRDGEDPRTDAAVARTRGRVLTFAGGVVPAYYSSSSGGRTESVQHVWGGHPVPYLRSVPDPFDAVSPYHRAWPDPLTYGAAELGRRLGLGQPVARLVVLARGDSPRVTRLRAEGVRGATAELAGDRVRTALGLRSTWFTVTRRGAAPRAAPGRVRLTAAQLRINQRISQAAVRRVNLVTAHLGGRPAPAARPAGSPGRVRLTAAQLRINQRISQAAVRRVNLVRAHLAGRPAPAARPAGSPGRVRLTAAQLRINQRISQAAVRRVNAVMRELGLT